MITIRVHPNVLPLPHNQHSYSIVREDGSISGPFGPFSLDELGRQLSERGLAPSDIQNFLDQVGPSKNGFELTV